MNDQNMERVVHTNIVFAAVFVVWVLAGVIVSFCFSGWAERGQFGDMFGAVNALFSGLAFAGLIVTIFLQRNELALQRVELELTREELKRGADAQNASSKALEKQIELLTLSTQMGAWLKAQEVWTASIFTEGRGLVFARIDTPKAPWLKDHINNAKEVCRRMDEFAHLVPFLGLDKVLDTWDDPLGKAWLVLGDVVLAERANSNWSTKWKGFESIGTKALEKLKRENRAPKICDEDKTAELGR